MKSLNVPYICDEFKPSTGKAHDRIGVTKYLFYLSNDSAVIGCGIKTRLIKSLVTLRDAKRVKECRVL